MRRPGTLDAGPFAADVASFGLHLAAENKAAGTIRIYTEVPRWFAAAHLLCETDKTRVGTGKQAGCPGWSRQVQAEGVTYLLSELPKVTRRGDPVVTRIYYMRFAGPNNDALIVAGNPQCAYSAAVNRPSLPACALAPASTPSDAPMPTATTASVPGSSPAAAQYEIRNGADNLCLDANDKGPTAGQNGDKVQLWNCYGAASQEWVPEYQSGQLAWRCSSWTCPARRPSARGWPSIHGRAAYW